MPSFVHAETKKVVAKRSNQILTAQAKLQAPDPITQQITSSIDLRPSWVSNSNQWYMENEAAIRFSATKNWKLGYTQDFFIGSPDKDSTKSFLLGDGYFSSEFKNLITDPSGVSFSYEPRVYVPTEPTKSAAGFITAIRNYAKVQWKVSSQVSLHFYEIPIIYVFSQPGSGTSANPTFENRVMAGVSWKSPNGKAELMVPVFFSFKKHANYQDDAKFNDDWSQAVWLQPEFTYEVINNLRLGVGYQSSSLFSNDLSVVNVGEGFQNGVTQFIFRLDF
jgi:hypothetical protein